MGKMSCNNAIYNVVEHYYYFIKLLPKNTSMTVCGLLLQQQYFTYYETVIDQSVQGFVSSVQHSIAEYGRKERGTSAASLGVESSQQPGCGVAKRGWRGSGGSARYARAPPHPPATNRTSQPVGFRRPCVWLYDAARGSHLSNVPISNNNEFVLSKYVLNPRFEY